jgi:hypothetical protein
MLPDLQRHCRASQARRTTVLVGTEQRGSAPNERTERSDLSGEPSGRDAALGAIERSSQERLNGRGGTFPIVAGRRREPDAPSEQEERRAAREAIGAYHQDQLRVLLEHVREGFNRLDAGEIDEFELDDLIHRYKRAAKQLWLFCDSSGSQSLHVAAVVASMRERGEERDWWGGRARRGDRS